MSLNRQILLLSRSFYPNFGQGPFPKIAGESPDVFFRDNRFLPSPVRQFDCGKLNHKAVTLKNVSKSAKNLLAQGHVVKFCRLIFET